MNRNLDKLEAAIEHFEGYVSGHGYEALKAMKAQLAAMEPEVWIPPKGMIVKSDDGAVYESKGRLTEDGYLYVVPDGFISAWKRIPGLVQFIKHDGSNVCPCEDKPVYFKQADEDIYYAKHPNQKHWKHIKWWVYTEDLKGWD